MIEIVAKAIYDDNRGITMDLARSIAKVAIMAMREPTEDMVKASRDQPCREAWADMIDEALK